jgi:hypothetical protein
MPYRTDDGDVSRHRRVVSMGVCLVAVVVSSSAWSGWSLKELFSGVLRHLAD